MNKPETDKTDQYIRQDAEPTLDGRRLQINELNLDSGKGQGRWRRLLRNLSLFMAGMYTGESCGGTPHSSRPRRGAPPKDQ
jgi:hypothetical protein